MKKITRIYLGMFICLYMAAGFCRDTQAYADEYHEVNWLSIASLDSEKVSDALETLINAEYANSSQESGAVLNSMRLIYFLDSESRSAILKTLMSHPSSEIQNAALKFVDENDADLLSEALFSDSSKYVRGKILLRMFQFDRNKPKDERLFEEAVQAFISFETDPGLLALADHYISNCAEDTRSPDADLGLFVSELEGARPSLSWKVLQLMFAFERIEDSFSGDSQKP